MKGYIIEKMILRGFHLVKVNIIDEKEVIYEFDKKTIIDYEDNMIYIRTTCSDSLIGIDEDASDDTISNAIDDYITNIMDDYYKEELI